MKTRICVCSFFFVFLHMWGPKPEIQGVESDQLCGGTILGFTILSLNFKVCACVRVCMCVCDMHKHTESLILQKIVCKVCLLLQFTKNRTFSILILHFVLIMKSGFIDILNFSLTLGGFYLTAGWRFCDFVLSVRLLIWQNNK